jgi:hypothetical protein
VTGARQTIAVILSLASLIKIHYSFGPVLKKAGGKKHPVYWCEMDHNKCNTINLTYITIFSFDIQILYSATKYSTDNAVILLACKSVLCAVMHINSVSQIKLNSDHKLHGAWHSCASGHSFCSISSQTY